MDYLQQYIDAYMKRLGGELTADNMGVLTGEQHALLSFMIVHDEVMDGGFIQLIQNGYGGYIFDNPFAKAMRLFGMKDFSKLLYKVKAFYDLHKASLEQERSDEEFMAMYEQYEVFDEWDDMYITEEEEWCGTMSEYVRTHEDSFILK